MDDRKTLISINLANNGSTGKIMMQVAAFAKAQGYETYQVYPKRKGCNPMQAGDIAICSEFWMKIYQRICRYIGFNGCSAMIPTAKLLKKLDKLQPSIIQLHNLHNSYINLPMLFRYIKRNNIPVVWTLHDCWAFTGHCPHFTFVGCEKWKTGCYGCNQYKLYPESAFDDSRRMYRLKQKWFCGVKNMTIVTPSRWLADLVKQSFLKEYSVQVINNGIDLSVFRPVESDFRKRQGIKMEANIVLSVAFGWGSTKKGLDVMVKLAQKLPENYQVVMVGTDDFIDQKLPDNIISIHRTNNQQELAGIYSAADLFVLPTREENYPTVNMEAIACGTPVLTFRTGGSSEIPDKRTGRVVDCDDFDAIYQEVLRICKDKPYSQKDCLMRAKSFDMKAKYKQYLALYDEALCKKDMQST
ncbi:MAG: glycosyltransferase [Oscillospiraceae bacterium]|nr:glycosyltransferase [Oscillospiraceae bacterium]